MVSRLTSLSGHHLSVWSVDIFRYLYFWSSSVCLTFSLSSAFSSFSIFVFIVVIGHWPMVSLALSHLKDLSVLLKCLSVYYPTFLAFCFSLCTMLYLCLYSVFLKIFVKCICGHPLSVYHQTFLAFSFHLISMFVFCILYFWKYLQSVFMVIVCLYIILSLPFLFVHHICFVQEKNTTYVLY